MHSAIFQIDMNPINTEDYFDVYRYNNGFVGEIANGIKKSTDKNRIQDINSLKYDLRDIAVFDSDNDHFTIIDKKKYFERKYKDFRQYLKDLSSYSFEDFCSDPGLMFKMFELNDTFSYKYGFYIDDKDDGLYTLDNFLRRVKNGDIFFIGSVFSYGPSCIVLH